MEEEDRPGPSNVTGRERRARRTRPNQAAEPEDAHDDPADDLPPVAEGGGEPGEVPRDQEHLRRMIASFLQQAQQDRKKVNNTNCFSEKTALELFGIQRLIDSDVKMQDMAMMLDSSQMIYGCRVDRLYVEVTGATQAFSTGKFDGEGNAEANTSKVPKSRKKKDKDNEGLVAVEKALNEYNLQQGEAVAEEATNQLLNDSMNDEDENVEDEIWDDDDFLQERIKNTVAKRVQKLETKIFSDRIAAYSVIDDRPILNNSRPTDYLKTNSLFQKGAIGSIDEITSNFHNLMHNGITSGDGRVFKAHNNLKDPERNYPINPADVNIDVVKNMRNVIANAMSTAPPPLKDILMLEVPDRPKTGVSKMLLNCPAHQRVWREMALAIPDEDTVMDMSEMSSVNAPSVAGANGTTLDETLVTQPSDAKEARLPAYEEIFMPDNIEHLLPATEPFSTAGLDAILEIKTTMIEEEEDGSKRVWSKGLMAEEWHDQTCDMSRAVLPVIKSGVDPYVRAIDHMVNSDVVSVIYTRDTLAKLESEALNKNFPNPAARKLPCLPDKYFMLKKSDKFKKLYPQDRRELFLKEPGTGDVDVPIQLDDGNDQEEGGGEDEDMEVQEIFEGCGDDICFDESLVAPITDEVVPMIDHANQEEDEDVVEAFFDGVDDDQPRVYNREQEAYRIALGPEELPALLTSGPPDHGITIRPEVEAEIQNLGKADNSHWKALTNEAEKKQTRKRKERKIKKKIGIEDFDHYFEPSTDLEQIEKSSAVRCEEVSDPTVLQLKENQIYMTDLSKDAKPHVAFEFEALSRYGLMFKKKYGKLRFERVHQKKSARTDVLVDDMKGGTNVQSSSLQWLLSFNGFRCSYQNDDNSEDEQMDIGGSADDTVVGFNDEHLHFDDRITERERNIDRQLLLMRMGQDTKEKYQMVLNEAEKLRELVRKTTHGDEEELDSEDDGMGAFKKDAKAHNLDATKHKHTIAELLNSSTLSMPNLQYLLESLANENQPSTSTPSTSSSSAPGPSRSLYGMTDEQQRDLMTTPLPSVSELGLTTVFEYHSPQKRTLDIEELLKNLTEVPDYQASDRQNANAGNADIDPNNPPVEKVNIDGIHTFQSMMLCLPHKLKEHVEPSAVLSFLLHLCNENNLQLVQDKSNKNWMQDILILAPGQDVPDEFCLGNDEDRDEFWRETHDPCASMGKLISMPSGSGTQSVSRFTPSTPASTSTPKQPAKRGARKRLAPHPVEPQNLDQIMEEPEEEEEEMLPQLGGSSSPSSSSDN